MLREDPVIEDEPWELDALLYDELPAASPQMLDASADSEAPVQAFREVVSETLPTVAVDTGQNESTSPGIDTQMSSNRATRHRYHSSTGSSSTDQRIEKTQNLSPPHKILLQPLPIREFLKTKQRELQRWMLNMSGSKLSLTQLCSRP